MEEDFGKDLGELEPGRTTSLEILSFHRNGKQISECHHRSSWICARNLGHFFNDRLQTCVHQSPWKCTWLLYFIIYQMKGDIAMLQLHLAFQEHLSWLL